MSEVKRSSKADRPVSKRMENKRTVSFDTFPNQFLSSSSALAVWTVRDQKRLVSMDSLYSRSMEFHRNVHTKDTPLTLFPAINIGAPEPSDFESAEIVANLVIISNEKSKKLLQQLQYSQFYSFCHNTLKDKSKQKTEVIKPTEPEFYWIHLKDLNILDLLMNIFQMHELIAAGFHDLRQHTTVLPNGNELFFSNVICLLEGNTFRMFKFYVYMRGNVLVTYEVELFPDLEEPEDALLAANNDPTAHVNNPLQNDGDKRTISTASATGHSTPDNPVGAVIADKIMQLFFMNIAKLKKKVFELGIFYMVYEISLYFLTQYDSTIEFISSSLSYFNRIIHLNLLHRERMKILLKIHMISAGISLVRKAIEGDVETYGKLCEYSQELGDDHGISRLAGGGGDSPISPHMSAHSHSHANHISRAHLNKDHFLYVLDLLDSYNFKRNSLQKQHEEMKRVETELNATIALRTTNTNTMLSLIATTFLPLTFFAGVFGMNFTVDGGYTIALLNSPQGPNVFIILCLVSFMASLFFFIYLGWLEFGIFASIYKRLNKARIDDSNKVDLDPKDDGIDKALQRAEEEENRRRDEATMMRASYSTFSNRMSMGGGISGRRGSTGARQSQMSSSRAVHAPIEVQTNYPQLHRSNAVKGADSPQEKHVANNSSLNVISEVEGDDRESHYKD